MYIGNTDAQMSQVHSYYDSFALISQRLMPPPLTHSGNCGLFKFLVLYGCRTAHAQRRTRASKHLLVLE